VTWVAQRVLAKAPQLVAKMVVVLADRTARMLAALMGRWMVVMSG
jgi:hypothetical protein